MVDASAANLLGAVLTGGASMRMGRDKALLVVDGMTLVDRTASLLRLVCADVIAVGPSVLAGSVRPVEDRYPGEGPLGGVLSALSESTGFQGVFVVACDLPQLDEATVRTLVTAFGLHPAADVVVADTGRLQPLCAIWRPGCRSPLQREFDGGERAVHRTVALLKAQAVLVHEAALRNVNSPEEWASG